MSTSHDHNSVLIISLKRLDEHLKIYREQYGAVLAFRPTGDFFPCCYFIWILFRLLVWKVKLVFRLDLLREDRWTPWSDKTNFKGKNHHLWCVWFL